MMNTITWGDKILVAALIFCTVGSLFALSLFASHGSTVIVELKGMVVYKGDLNEDRKVTLHGAYGDVRVRIDQGKVAVVYADCPNKICVRTGWRFLGGDVILCVPNQVLVRIEADRTTEVRGITG